MTNGNVQDADVRLDFEAAFEGIKKEVDRVLSAAPLVLRPYTSHLAKAQGKFIRAYALAASAMDTEGCIHPDAVYLGAAVEILHLATLVHDDVMDNADLRRGILTLQSKFGRKAAVICGDYLLAAALKELTKVTEPEGFKNLSMPQYVERICTGELRQYGNNKNLNLSVYRYLSIINGKTAALFEASFYGGAVLCETDEKRCRMYRQLGNYIGMIFQLTDDCIDFETDEHTAKKNVQSDYEQGVITLPLIYTFQKMPEIKEQAKTEQLEREALNQAVKKAGGLVFTKGVAEKYYKKATDILDSLAVSEGKRKRLCQVLDKAYYGLSPVKA